MNIAQCRWGKVLAGERAQAEQVIRRQGAGSVRGLGLAVADLERIYRSLRLIRRAEEEVARSYRSDKIKSSVHLLIDREAVSVGVCDVLRADDLVAPARLGYACPPKAGNCGG